jgi:alpha-glucuronidase
MLIKLKRMKVIIGIFIFMFAPLCLRAENGHQLWLRARSTAPVKVICSRSSATIDIAERELHRCWQGKPNTSVVLQVKHDPSVKNDGYKLTHNGVQANTDLGILYGVDALLRKQQTGEPIIAGISNPSYERRILDHWDNLNGSIERGYAGRSIFWHGKDSLTVTENDKRLWREYARADASIGINGAVLNNVNASPLVLTEQYLKRVQAIADVLRPYGIKTYLSVNFASPIVIGGLKTADPLDPEVKQWWKTKVREIYKMIPDFGGFLVKANSEGQPGPQSYGRTHADGANTIADALKPFGGILMWRAFVYSNNGEDRAKQAYLEFMPLDGSFHDNVIIQVKNGPIDFQPREPFSPLFGAMKKTSVMPELQITQEYLGQSIHLVFLATMWEEFLKSDTYQAGKGSTVARCTDGSIYTRKYTAIAGVANIGSDTNWCGHPFAQANWYAFGRLAWNNRLTSEQIADEWIKRTFYQSPPEQVGAPVFSTYWKDFFLKPVKKMMLESREAAVNYMTPLGLNNLFSAKGHYGPGPWWAPKGVRKDWTPPYFHRADSEGIGFDRTRTGSNAVSQYHEPVSAEFNNLRTCPDKYLLWFHHVPWVYVMQNGRTLWDNLCYHYQAGLDQVRNFQKVWDSVKPFVDPQRFHKVQSKLRQQCLNAQLWKDACLLYFQQFSKMPIPYDIERPVHDLQTMISNDEHDDTTDKNPNRRHPKKH